MVGREGSGECQPSVAACYVSKPLSVLLHLRRSAYVQIFTLLYSSAASSWPLQQPLMALRNPECICVCMLLRRCPLLGFMHSSPAEFMTT